MMGEKRGRGVGYRALPWLLMILPVLCLVAGAFGAVALGRFGPALGGLAGAAALLSLILSAWAALTYSPEAGGWECLAEALNALRRGEVGVAKGALGLGLSVAPEGSLVKGAMEEASKALEGGDERRALGALLSVNPVHVPSVRAVIVGVALWNGIVAFLVGIGAMLAWQLGGRALAAAPEEQRALLRFFQLAVYAICGGVAGATLYCFRSLMEHIERERDFSTRSWPDYVLRPAIGAILGGAVYLFLKGLTWALGAPMGGERLAGATLGAIGLLAGFATRRVIFWLNQVAKVVFQVREG